MPEELPIALLQPGHVIPFESIADIPPFEDRVAAHIDQQMSQLDIEGFLYNPLEQGMWAGRVAIKELLTIPKFHGPMSNIRFIKMPDAYDAFTSSAERDIRVHGGGGKSGISGEYAELTIPMYQGFQFMADARSANGWEGHIQAEVFYYPIPLRRSKNQLRQNPHSYGGQTIYRRVSKPSKTDAKAYAEAHERSKEIGREVLADGMRKARPAPMRN